MEFDFCQPVICHHLLSTPSTLDRFINCYLNNVSLLYCLWQIQYKLNWIFSTVPHQCVHEIKRGGKKACATTSKRQTLNMCPNVCYATQLFPAFSMPLLTYHNTYIKINPSGIKFMHHSTSFPVILISISGMNISRQNLVPHLLSTASAV